MPKKVIIVGGGAAGLAAAVALLSRGVQVELFESRPFLGGRLHSFAEPVMGAEVDNGQHLFAGFYYETFKFLSIIGSSDHLTRQDRLSIDFIGKDGVNSNFSCGRLPGSLGFLWGLFKFNDFPNADLWRLVKNRCKLKRDLHTSLSAEDFLKLLGQSEIAINNFFRPLVLATLNSELKDVSAILFRDSLQVMARAPSRDNVLVYSTVGLSDLFARPAEKFIVEAGGKICNSCPIDAVRLDEGSVQCVIDISRVEHRADSYIFALPPDALDKIMPNGVIDGLDRWKYSPIISVNLWYDRPVMDRLMVGLKCGRFDWVFNKGSYVTLLKSAAVREAEMTKGELIDIAVAEMSNCFGKVRGAKVVHSQVIKEKKATVLISPELASERLGVETGIDNLRLAGDWVATGLPATVESAIMSGFMAADMV